MRLFVPLQATATTLFMAASLCAATTATTPAVTPTAAYRFLAQSTWGPKPADVSHVQQVGFASYLTEQFQATPSPLPDVTGTTPSMTTVQQQFFVNAVGGSDQLRQRVAFALSELWVVSTVKVNDANGMNHYLRVLQADAFKNFYDVMYDVTLNPAMGHYLDMVNNDKPNVKTGRGSNENYAREIMQLFTLGLSLLNPDGSLKKDANGQPIPTYTQDQVEGFARVFTGWTYAALPGAVSLSHNPTNYLSPMVAVQANHDTDAKTLLSGVTLPGGQTAEKDLSDGLHNIFNHPNMGPFVCRQLIQHLVTSNPSAAYVKRVAAVFADNGKHVRGDMQAVISAILLDTEARAGDAAMPPAGEGHLKEPVLFLTSLLRGLGATVVLNNNLPSYSLGQQLYYSPTVFNYFAPDYEIAGTTVNAPEFEILSSSLAMSRADFANSLVYGTITGVTLDLTPYTTAAADPTKLMTLLNSSLLGYRASAQMEASLTKAMLAASTAKAKAQCALYLTGSSWQFQVIQ